MLSKHTVLNWSKLMVGYERESNSLFSQTHSCTVCPSILCRRQCHVTRFCPVEVAECQGLFSDSTHRLLPHSPRSSLSPQQLAGFTDTTKLSWVLGITRPEYARGLGPWVTVRNRMPYSPELLGLWAKPWRCKSVRVSVATIILN